MWGLGVTDIAQALRPAHSVPYGDRRLRFVWRPRGGAVNDSVARKARIHVYPNGLVEVETPADAVLAEAKKALLKRAGWVVRHLRQIEARQAQVLDRRYVSGETVFYLGRRYVLKVIQSDTLCETKLLGGRLNVTIDNVEAEAVKAALNDWYRTRSLDVFARRLAVISERLSWVREEPSWSIREMKKQWGSCSPSGSVLLNPHLVKAPTRCIDYVILHELCHLEEHNHSSRFYMLMGKAMPDWESVKARLDAEAELYLNV